MCDAQCQAERLANAAKEEAAEAENIVLLVTFFLLVRFTYSDWFWEFMMQEGVIQELR